MIILNGGQAAVKPAGILFSNGQARAVFATDVAARGIHVEDVDTVIHYNLAGDHKDYLHRSGRTARAGATGSVVTLVTDGQDGEAKKLLRKLDRRKIRSDKARRRGVSSPSTEQSDSRVAPENGSDGMTANRSTQS